MELRVQVKVDRLISDDPQLLAHHVSQTERRMHSSTEVIMPMNRVQFQPGMSLMEFVDRFGTEEACEAEVERQRWPNGWVCPACSGRQYSNFRRGRLLYFQCCDCRHQCSLLSGTVFASSKLGLRVWFAAGHLLSQAKNNVSALELKRHLGVCYRTAWLVKHKLMEAMRVREVGRTLGGTVQID